MTEKKLPQAGPVDVWRDPYADTFVINPGEDGQTVVTRNQMGDLVYRLFSRLYRINEDYNHHVNVYDVSDAQLLSQVVPRYRESFGRILGDPKAKQEATKRKAAEVAARQDREQNALDQAARRGRRQAREQYAASRAAVLNTVGQDEQPRLMIDPNYFRYSVSGGVPTIPGSQETGAEYLARIARETREIEEADAAEEREYREREEEQDDDRD